MSASATACPLPRTTGPSRPSSGFPSIETPVILSDRMDSALEKLSETIRAAGRSRRALRLRGGGTKDFYGQALDGEVLDTPGHNRHLGLQPPEPLINPPFRDP